ncbi:hypothetical protein ccbrp13_51580 [Ktedonobacteria bacterium brp13]|nr:hypothetical protein ccbrp13_51580 [Ktedonobacteria bacterium brp13]
MQPTIVSLPGGVSDQNATGKLLQFQGDLFTLKYPEYFGRQEVYIPGQPAGNHRFVFPMAPHSGLDVYEHDEDQDPGLIAAHTLSLTNAEMVQAAVNTNTVSFTSATGIHWVGWDVAITLSHQPLGYSGKYEIRILVHDTDAYQHIVVGVIAPESGFATNYQTVFLPIIQSLTLK